MIDIKFLRENPDIVKDNIRKKFQEEKLALVDEVIALDAENRRAKQEGDDLRASRNKISKEIGKLMGQGKKEEAEAMCKEAGRARGSRGPAAGEDYRNHDEDSQYHRPFCSHWQRRQRECGDPEVW